MDKHPEICRVMPIFEDKKKLKLPPTIAGLDFYQTHLKTAAIFIKSKREELVMSRLSMNIPAPLKPPSSAVVDPIMTTLDGRH
jgi:hypothetical protein